MKPGIDYIGVAAGAMIFNDEGKLFLSKRSWKASNEKGCWETPGGKVRFGETHNVVFSKHKTRGDS